MEDDFLACKRHESSEGSLDEEEDDEPHQFAQEELNHHSDEEENRRDDRRNQNNDRPRPTNNEENKDYRGQEQKKIVYPKNDNKKKDYYLYAGEEKPYESDGEEEAQGQRGKGKRENAKNEKKDPTFVPKGTFYQHDTRGEDTEYVPKKNAEKSGKQKWRHDKFEKPYNNSGNGSYGKGNREGGDTYYDKKEKAVVYYVAKGEGQSKAPEEEPQQQKQQQQQPREDRPQQSRGKGGYANRDYDKGDYKDKGYNQDRGYNQNSGKYKGDYAKKEYARKTPGGNAGGNRGQDVYYEYVPKKQV